MGVKQWCESAEGDRAAILNANVGRNPQSGKKLYERRLFTTYSSVETVGPLAGGSGCIGNASMVEAEMFRRRSTKTSAAGNAFTYSQELKTMYLLSSSNRRGFGRLLFVVASAVIGAALPALKPIQAEEAAPTKSPPPLTRKTIEEIVSRNLRNDPLYMPGDAICQSDVEPIFNELIERGYRSADNEGLYDSFLSANDKFIKSMRTPEGRMFMRSVAKMPGAYDRLERLSWSNTGRALLAEMIASGEGKKAMEHILSDEGSKLVEGLLARDPRGQNFRLPTGKVHTANELIDHLCEIYLKAHKE